MRPSILWVTVLVLALSACGDQPNEQKTAESVEPEPWPLVWLHEEGNCQNTETRVLVANAANLITWADPEACEIASGTWQSWGRDAVLPLHLIWVVPLVTPGHASDHGAIGWTEEERIAFINDMDNLIILDPVSAKERAHYGPVFWTPLERFWCEYAQRWQKVKDRYQLTSDSEEQKALARMLQECSSEVSE